MSSDSNFLKVLTRINIFKEPREALKAVLQMKLHSTIIELCTEIMSSGIGLIPEFKAFFRYEDLHFCTGRINRRLKQWMPFYAVKMQTIKKTNKRQDIADSAIEREYAAYMKAKAANITAEQIERDKRRQQKNLHKSLKSVDSMIRHMGFEVAMDLGELQFSITERTHENKMVSVGFGGQKVHLQKKGNVMKGNMCGVKVASYYGFDEIYKTLQILGEQGKTYVNNLGLQISTQTYRDFLQNIDTVRKQHPNSEQIKKNLEEKRKKAEPKSQLIQSANQISLNQLSNGPSLQAPAGPSNAAALGGPGKHGQSSTS